MVLLVLVVIYLYEIRIIFMLAGERVFFGLTQEELQRPAFERSKFLKFATQKRYGWLFSAVMGAVDDAKAGLLGPAGSAVFNLGREVKISTFQQGDLGKI